MDQWNVLVVDDEPLMRDMLAQFLTRKHCTVTLLGTFEDLLPLLDHITSFDLVVTDFQLGPCYTGRDVIEMVRSADPTMPIILLSGGASDQRDTPEQVSQEYPRVQFVRKPTSLRDLFAHMKEIVGEKVNQAGSL